MERLYGLGKTFATLIANDPDFELPVAEPESNIVCFRLKQKDWSEEKTEQVNAAVRDRLIKESEYYIVQTRVQGKLYLRTTIMNPFTTEKELGGLLEKIRESGLSSQ